MKRIIQVALLLLLSATGARAQSPASVSGNLKTLLGGNADNTNSFLRFCLQNYKPNVPYVSNVGQIMNECQDLKPSSLGVVSGSVWGNDLITPANTYYRIERWYQGRMVSSANYNITGSVFNLNSAVPLSTVPTASTSTVLTQVFVCNVSVASVTWTCSHGLNDTNVIATFFDNASPAQQIFPDTVKLTDSNTLTATFTIAQAGKAIILRAGNFALTAGSLALGDVVVKVPGAGQSIVGAYPLTFDTGIIGKINNIRYVDGVKFTSIQAAHDDFGATCGEIVVTSNLSLSGTTTLSKPGCKLNLGAVTLTLAAGAQLAITGADTEVFGLGDKSLIDASTGTSATSPVYVSNAGARAYLHDFKVTGNRVAGGTAYTVQVGDASGVVDSVKVERVTSLNSGATGIYAVKTTNFKARWNRIVTPTLSGIGIDTSSNHTRLEDNYIEDPNPGATAGNAGIAAFSQATLAHLDLIVSRNTVNFTGTGSRAGMELDSVDGLQVLNNRVTGSHATGEGIAFTATRALVHGNYVSDGLNGGILCYLTALASSDVIISNNTAINNTTYGIAVMWGANTLTASNIILMGNRGAALGGTQSIAIQLVHDSGKTGGVIGSGFILEANDGFGSGAGGPVNIDVTLTGKPTLNDYASNSSGLKDVPSGFLYRFVNNAGNGYITALQKDASDIVQVGDTSGTAIGGVVKSVNAIATVANGVPAEYAQVNLTAQTAAVTTTTLYAVPASGAGQYRLSWNAKVTTPATTGAGTSTLGALTIVYTDPDGVVQTITAPASVAAGTIATTSTGNSTTTVLLGMPLLLNCKLSTNITYAFAYASDTANQMAYNLHLVLEKQ